jgi:hypothetical protein
MASTVEHDADSSVQHIEPAGEAVEEEFHRGLKERHIQMIAIGGAIGVGLFLGSAKAIQQAGPSLLLSYAVAGVVIYFIMRALGELFGLRGPEGIRPSKLSRPPRRQRPGERASAFRSTGEEWSGLLLFVQLGSAAGRSETTAYMRNR